MFQFLKNPHFDFMKHGKALLIVSAIACAASAGILMVNGVELGVEFAGGSELQLKFLERPDISAVRGTLQRASVGGATVTTIGDPELNEIYIKIASSSEGDVTGQVTEALREGRTQAGKTDLNIVDEGSLEALLGSVTGMTLDGAAQLATEITDYRRDNAIIRSIDDLQGLPSMSPEALELFRQQAYAGPLVVRSQSYIGPAIGKELIRNALGAVVGSLIGMLIYIWIRFQLQWGFAAVVALAHDTLITLGLFSLFGQEMSLPVVAAFLTLVGYSVNDTVVVFDRIRENVRLRQGKDFAATVNLSINQTLSRTIITSGLTFVVVFGLYMFGGGALKSFSFVLSAGVVVGTYSSIYIASPLLVLWEQYRGDKGGAREQSVATADKPTAPRVRKVRRAAE